MSDQRNTGEFEPSFARGITNGKRNSRVEACVTDETKLALTSKAHSLGMTESAYIERLIELSLFGVDHVLSVERERILKVGGLSGLVPMSVGGQI